MLILFFRKTSSKSGHGEKALSARPSSYPDIYYIILDSYANSNTLKEDYGYDNHEFIDYLEKKGFYVAFKSVSNYHVTSLSLASSLNMEYINGLSGIAKKSSQYIIIGEMVRNNRAKDFLKSKGYKFVNLGSQWLMDNYNWYALYVKSRHEFTTMDELKRKGINTFLPFVKKLRQWKDRRKFVDFPLFPGYLFVYAEKERLYDVKYTRGVTRIIGTDIDAPTPIPDKQILDIKSVMETEVQLDPFPYLKKGRMVRIKSGPLKGLEGILVERKGHYKLVIF